VVAFGDLTSTHRPKTCGQAKIPSPKPPFLLPARFCPLRGRAVASNLKILIKPSFVK